MCRDDWKHDFVRLLFPTNHENMRNDEAEALKFQYMPNSLYRYRSVTECNIENLKNGIEWMSYPKDFNDPFDSSFKVSFRQLRNEIYRVRWMPKILKKLAAEGIDFSESEIEQIKGAENSISMLAKFVAMRDPSTAEKADEFAEVIDKAIADEFDHMGDEFRSLFREGYLVTCFSEQHKSIVMWSHYAGNHTGYCIEYDFKSLGPDHPRTRMLYPVIYNKEFFDATEYYRASLLGDTQNFNNIFGIYVTISKSPEWCYEREWRMIFPIGPNAGDEYRALQMPKPKRIYLGARMKDEDRDKILKIAQEKEIPVHQIVLSKEEFALLDEKIL